MLMKVQKYTVAYLVLKVNFNCLNKTSVIIGYFYPRLKNLIIS